MILGLYIMLAVLCIVLVTLGLVLSEYGGLAMIGFAIFFIISMIMISGNIEIKTGENVTTLYDYDATANINATHEQSIYQYSDWNDTYSKQIGFWSAIGSAFGFIFLLYTIRKSKRREEEL